jgi:hypothetical protein
MITNTTNHKKIMKTQERPTTENKVCTACKKDKLITDFYLRRRSPAHEYEYQTQCKECIKLRDNKKYNAEPSKRIESAAKYRASNRDKINESAANYREANRAIINLNAASFREGNRELLSERSSKWYEAANKNDKEFLQKK